MDATYCHGCEIGSRLRKAVRDAESNRDRYAAQAATADDEVASWAAAAFKANQRASGLTTALGELLDFVRFVAEHGDEAQHVVALRARRLTRRYQGRR
jgi:hypothetical protein